MSKVEEFSSRWGIVLASLGMAIGAGNLWRFPRLAGQYGGAFIILWIVFLLVWSIPILLAEFSIGKQYKMGTIGSYAKASGKQFTWAGFFITICTLGIAFYYSVVTGWALQYVGLSMSNLWNITTGGPSIADKLEADPTYLDTFWDGIANGNMWTVALYIVAIVAGLFLLVRGIKRGLETANKILIPTLFLMLVLISILSLNMESGLSGLEYMFSVNTDYFFDPAIWIEALSQSAWSTGAGWGLIMTLSSYTRKGEDVTLNTFIGGFGNNTASLVAAMAILPAVFALSPSQDEAVSYLQAGNQALMFTIIPKLFSTFSGGAFLSLVFFLAFFLAAFSSLLPMLELFISNLMDLGLTRGKAAIRVLVFCVIFGFPSAYALDFFSNQDWVWGVGLILSGFFIIITVIRTGPRLFKEKFIDQDSDFKVNTTYFVSCMFLNAGLAVVLVYWWLSRGYSDYPWFDADGNWNFIDVYSNASVITQWLIVLVLGFILNKWLYKKIVKS